MRHFLALAFSVGGLTVGMAECAVGSFLVASTRSPKGFFAADDGTFSAAVNLPSVTVAADADLTVTLATIEEAEGVLDQYGQEERLDKSIGIVQAIRVVATTTASEVRAATRASTFFLGIPRIPCFKQSSSDAENWKLIAIFSEYPRFQIFVYILKKTRSCRRLDRRLRMAE